MKLIDYLLFAIQEKCYKKKAWVVSVFSVTQESDEQKKNTYPGKLIREPFGFFTVSKENEKIQIDTKNPLTEPLLSIKERLTITKAWIGSLQEDALETSAGTLLVNLICLYEAFGDKFPYKAGTFSPGDLEKEIVKKLQSTPKAGSPREAGVYYVDEYLKFCEGILFLEGFAQLFTHSITRQGLLPAPGRKAFRDELVKKYGDTLRDPVVMAKFEAELSNFDKAYLKSDPAYGKFMSGKVAKSRMKAYMTQGGEANSFIQSMEVTPIVQPLEEGFPLDKEGFTAVSNTIRYGSFSRGSETVNGGVTAKALMRAADNWKITEGDCGTNLGIRRLYRESEINHIVGRYIVTGGKSVLVETPEQAKAFINQKIVLRSPQYCRRSGTQTCEVCAGLALAKYPTGLPIPLMEVSGGILTDSLKLMHNTALVTEVVHLPSVIT
jgi:hypothetical protein